MLGMVITGAWARGDTGATGAANAFADYSARNLCRDCKAAAVRQSELVSSASETVN